LAGGFVEEDAGGDGGVEAFDGAGAGDGDGAIGHGGERFGNAVAFIADEESDWAGEIDELDGFGSGCRGGEDAQAGFAQAGNGVDGAGGEDREAEDAAGGGADGFGVPGADGAGEGEDAGGSKGFSGAENGAEVPGVLNSGEDQNKRSGVLQAAEEVGPGPLGWLDKGGDGLRGFRGEGGIQKFAGKQHNFSLGGKSEGVEEALGTLGDEDAIDSETCAQGLLKQVRPLNAGQMRRTAARVPGGVGKRLAELLEAGVLLTLYNAKRHD